MTALWSESGVIFERTAFGTSKNFKNFNEFIFNLHYPVDSIYYTLEKACLRHDVTDASDKVFPYENNALLDASIANVIEIVRRHLIEFNSKDTVCDLWCYLDEAKRGCVRFINKKSWYAEVYILSEREFSAIHVVDDEEGKHFIPVVFSKDITKEFKKVSISGGNFLQHYSYRVTDGILGRRSRTWKEDGSSFKNIVKASRNSSFSKDKGDNL